jgi:MFS family permease
MSQRPGLGRSFRLLQIAVGSSDLGDGIFRVLVPLIGLTIDRSVTAITLVSLSMRLPGSLVTIPAGYLLDRSHRRPFVNFSSAVVRVVAMAAVCALVAAGLGEIWSLCLISFVAVAASNVNDLATQASLPAYVTREQLPVANSWVITAQVLLVQMVGPAAAGLLLGHSSPTIALLLVGALFVLAAMMFATLLGARTPRRTGTPAPGGVFHGFGFLLRDPEMLQLSLLSGLINLCYAMVFTFLPAWVVAPGPVQGTATDYGWTVATMAIGSLLGGTVGTRLRRVLTGPVVTRYGLLVVSGSFALVLTRSIPLIMVGLTCYGFVAIVWNVRATSYRQSSVPTEIFGRVNSAFRWFTMGAPAVGAAVAGVIANGFGIPAVFVVAVALLTAGAVVAILRPLAFAESAPTLQPS